jgi:Domain of unknown function DUF29
MKTELNAPAQTTSQGYKADFYAWTQQQVQLLRAGAWEQLDRVNLIEEIESLGKQQRQELRNRLGILLGHLLKWEFQADMRSKSWIATIREQRREILELLEESPSLQPYLPDALPKAYQAALDLAVRETALNYKDFPAQCLYQWEQILDTAFLPEQCDR